MSAEEYHVAGVDPSGCHSPAAFKGAVYDEGGAGTWLQDMKLEVVWYWANNEEVPEHLQPLVADD